MKVRALRIVGPIENAMQSTRRKLERDELPVYTKYPPIGSVKRATQGRKLP